MNESERDQVAGSRVSRRGFLALAGGLGGLALAGGVAAPAAYAAPTPTLPGEYFRKANQRTAAGTLYDNICVRINGDVARIFVPQTVVPGSTPTPVVWFYHGSGSDHNALEGGFRLHSQAVVDRGYVAICQTAGGTLYSHPTAVALQIAGGRYMASTFRVTSNVLRSTSGGGALAVETYARRLLPNISGMYNVNSTYSLRSHYEQGGNARTAMMSVFDNDTSAMDAADPARHGAEAWRATRMRIIVSTPSSSDTVVPPEEHGLALRALALPVAAEASVRTHSNGHNTPGFAVSDFMSAMTRWKVGAPAPAPDTQAPAVTLVSPTNGAVLRGTVTARITVTDNVGVSDVGIYAGDLRLGTATKYSGSEYRATVDTRTRANSTFTVHARATDAAGNVGKSSTARVTIKN